MNTKIEKAYNDKIIKHLFLYSDMLYLLFVGYIIVNYYIHSIGGDHSLFYLLGYGSIYFLIRGVLTVKPSLFELLNLFLIIWGIFEAVYGCLQLYDFTESNNSLYKITGTFLNPGPYAGFMSTISPIALYIALNRQKRNKLLTQIIVGISWTYIFLSLTILPATMSRSAWLAMGFGNGIVLFSHYRIVSWIKPFLYHHRKQIIIYFVTICLLVTAIGAGIYLLKKDSADGRLLMWKITTRIIVQHPLAGVGFGGFAGAYGQEQAKYFAEGNASEQEERVAGSPEYGFNEFLQITAENGIIGLILFLLLIGSAFRKAIRNKRIGIIGSLTAFLVFACFSYPFSVGTLSVIFVILLAMAASGNVQTTIVKSKNHRLWATCGFLILLLIPAYYALNGLQRKRQAITKWQEEQSFYNMEIYEETVNNYRNLYQQLKNEPKFLFEYGQCLSKTSQYEESNRILKEGTRLSADPMFWNIIGKNYQATQQYRQAEEAFKHAAFMIPHRIYPLYLLANLYFESGQTEKGIEMAQKVIHKEPKVMSSAIKEMKAEMKEKESRWLNVLLPKNQK